MGSKVLGFQPALVYGSEPTPRRVRRNVDMKLLSHYYGLCFPSPHLDMPGPGQGLYSRPLTLSGMRIYEKSVS